MKIQLNIRHGFCMQLAAIFFLTNCLFSQVHFSNEDAKKIIKVSGSNHFPKVGEVVELKLIMEIPKSTTKIKRNMGFSLYDRENINVIEGEPTKSIMFGDPQTVEINLKLQFTQSSFYEITATYSKSTYVGCQFSVGGAYRESIELSNLKESIKVLRNFIKKKRSGKNIGLSGISFNVTDKNNPNKQSILYISDFEKKNSEKIYKWNEKQFIKLKPQFDSLLAVATSIVTLKNSEEKKRIDQFN